MGFVMLKHNLLLDGFLPIEEHSQFLGRLGELMPDGLGHVDALLAAELAAAMLRLAGHEHLGEARRRRGRLDSRHHVADGRLVLLESQTAMFSYLRC